MIPRIELLDHGYIEYVEHWGSDERIVEAARMSTNKGFLGWDTDAKLLRYLYEHKHMTPFEMCGLVVEVKAPILVFREWHRHRTQSYNEMSGRYVALPNEDYVPDLDQTMERIASAGANKQARAAVDRTPSRGEVMDWLEKLEGCYSDIELVYRRGLELGIPKEIARCPVPVARYSRMRASANLRNWLAFLTLRTDAAAQWEIRQYANALGSLIGQIFPRTYELFLNDGGRQ